MSPAANASDGRTGKPLAVRMRPDLIVRRGSCQGAASWIVKDPLSLAYWRFDDEEFAILEMLDGRSGLEETAARFGRRFSPRRITAPELQQFIGRLHTSGLVLADAPGQSHQLMQRRRQAARNRLHAALGNVLAMRFPGVDPDRFLDWLRRRVGWLFSAPAVIAGLLLAASALLLVLTNFEAFCGRLPALRELFAPGNWLWLAVVLAGTKVLHELGHGLACKRLGGECHEMGLMLLVLTPCLYCDVSDSWLVASKWRRAAIGAAGMYVELLIASACTWLWWFTNPGPLHYLCLNVMFVCSVGTLLFNANPLLRYDGYYILSDLVEIPNLRQKAGRLLTSTAGSWLFGLPPQTDALLPRRHKALFAVYAMAAVAYRTVLVVTIVWFVSRVLEPYGLKIIGQLLAAIALYGIVVCPLWRAARTLVDSRRFSQMKRARLIATAAACAALAAVVALAPLPYRVECPAYVQPREAESVYVTAPGTLRAIHVAAGQRVVAGQAIATLENVDMELTVERLVAEHAELQVRLTSLRQRSLVDESASLEIAQLEEAIAAVEQRLANRRGDLDSLVVRAPADGVILPPPRRPKINNAATLPTWSGRPLDDAILGAHLAAGTLVCLVGEPNQLEAVLAVDQAYAPYVHEGQRVDIQLESRPGHLLTSNLTQVARVNMKSAPAALSMKSGGALATSSDSHGRERPFSATYQASTPLDFGDIADIGANSVPLSSRARARVHAGYRPLATRAWDALGRTFR